MMDILHSEETWAERKLTEMKTKRDQDRNAASVEFDRLQAEGSQKFGVLWLQCNMAVAGLRYLPYLPQEDARINALLSECARVMAERETQHTPARLTEDERETIASLRDIDDTFDPVQVGDVVTLIAIIDRLTQGS